MYNPILRAWRGLVDAPCVKWFVELFVRTQTHHQSAFAAQIAFFFFLSLFPFITVFVTLAGGMIPVDSLTDVMMGWKTVPMEIKELLLDFVRTAQDQNIPILSVSFIAILWATSRAYYALSHALSAAQGFEKPPNYWLSRLKGLGYTLALSLALLIALMTPILSKPVVSWLVAFIQLPSFYTPLILAVKWLFYMFVLGSLMLISYAFIPPKHQSFHQLIPGVLVAIVGWWLETLIFNTFVLRFTRFSLIYGTLATVVILMLWLYTLAGTLILGAHVNALYELKKEPPIESTKGNH